MADCPFNSADENIADFIYRIGSQQQIIGNPADIPCMDYVNDEYNIIYTPLDTVTPISLARYSYYTVPGLFSLLDSSSMDASGILTTFAAPALGNMGRGTLIGIVDTGIDYTNPLFRHPDGSTRIAGLWERILSLPACPPIMNSAVHPMALNLPGSKSMRPLPPKAPLTWCPPRIPMATAPSWPVLPPAAPWRNRTSRARLRSASS